jgi:succinate-semialdehyde dehydrogenase/glutarate-semialdehyde dehydrogenase
VQARFQNAGQSCIAAKRFIVEARVAEEFEQKFTQAIRKLKVGDPMDRTVDVGPLARGDLRDSLDRQVRESVAKGARVALGGAPLTGHGYYYQPTLLVDVTPEMPALHEEVFGPVAALVRVANEDAAIAMANASYFGLGAALWTRDLDRARSLASRIEAGSVFVNGMVVSDPRLPFGGVKRSGYGRELSAFGIQEFVNIQAIWIGEGNGRTTPAQTNAAVE